MVDEFAILMKFLRERSGLSARQLSEKSDLSPSYISKMEKGDVAPTVQTFTKIIKNLPVSDMELLYIVKGSKDDEEIE